MLARFDLLCSCHCTVLPQHADRRFARPLPPRTEPTQATDTQKYTHLHPFMDFCDGNGCKWVYNLSLQIVEFAREHGRVTMMDAIRLTGASRNTLKLHLRELTRRNHLEQHGRGRDVWYALK